MTVNKQEKKAARALAEQTGRSYTWALRQVREQKAKDKKPEAES